MQSRNIDVAPPQPYILHCILGIGVATQHAKSQGKKPGAKLFKNCCRHIYCLAKFPNMHSGTGPRLYRFTLSHRPVLADKTRSTRLSINKQGNPCRLYDTCRVRKYRTRPLKSNHVVQVRHYAS
jgi:hypothetical protein